MQEIQLALSKYSLLFQGYVLYSAIGSFFLPTLVMLFFYWRIYRAAVETTRAINQGIQLQCVWATQCFYDSLFETERLNFLLPYPDQALIKALINT